MPSTHKQEANVRDSMESREIQIKWDSALPPPAILAEYDNTVPGAAERYFSMWESEADFRREEERKEADRRFGLSRLGMLLGFVVNMGAFGTAVWLASWGMNGASIAAIVAAVMTNLVFFSSFTQKKQ